MELRSQLMRNLMAILMIAAMGLISANIWQLENNKRELTADLAHLSEIRYGLFNVDEWKVILVDVMSKNIEAFDLDPADREKMRQKVSSFLTDLIDDFEYRYHEKELNRGGGFLEQTKGALRSAVVSSTKMFDHLREDVPIFTEQILDFISDKENAELLRSYLTEKLDEYADATFAETDYRMLDHIVAKYAAENKANAIDRIHEQMNRIKKRQHPLLVAFYALLAAGILMILLIRLRGPIEHFAMLWFGITLLWLGLSLPMLEIDARISELNFYLLGEKITFTDQIVFYKCKSILEVVTLMLEQSDLKTIVVGVLLLLFSVLFPVSKLLSSVIYLHSERSRRNPVLRFLIFQTGKWSMADVLVVAIFMSYLGFSGILNDQLQQLENIGPNIDLLTTDRSKLLFGFYAFVGFVLTGLLIAYRLRQLPSNSDTERK